MGQHQEPFLLGMLAALSLGIWAAYAFALPIPPLTGYAVVAALMLAAGLAAWRLWRFTWVLFLVLALVFGAVRLSSEMLLPLTDISGFAGKEVRVTGTLTDTPTVKEMSDGNYRLRYELEAREAKHWLEEEVPVTGSLYLYATFKEKSAIPEARIGDLVTAEGRVRVPRGYLNPGMLDIELLYRTEGVTATLAAGQKGIEVEPVEGEGFKRWLASVRAHYLAAMEEVMPQEDAAAIFAMLFGGYAGLQPELLEAFTVTGLVHILSVSGSHISLLAAVVAYLAALFRLPRAVGAVLVIAVIIIYALLSGCVAPVLRSALMGGLAFIAVALERERESRRILILTGLVLLLINPLLLFQLSFELSFLATAGLLYLAPSVSTRLRALGLPKWLAAGLAITIAAQLATLPILAWYFSRVSIVSLVANLTVLPLVELIIVIGLFAGLAAFFLPLLGAFVYLLDSLILGIVYELSRALARLPGAQVFPPAMGAWLVFPYYLMLALRVMEEEWRGRLLAAFHKKRRPLGAFFLVALAFGVGFWYTRPALLTFTALDTGQGDALLLVTPSGKAMLFDTGGLHGSDFDIGERVLVPYLRHQGIDAVEAIFLTHGHIDHAGGAGAVLREMPVGRVYTAGEGRALYAASFGLSEADPLLNKLREAREGEVMELGGVRVEVVYAPPFKGGEGNEASNVYRITYGQASFLVTGDLTAENEAKLLASGKNIKSTVLKVAHHGSNTSSTEKFLAAVAPDYAVICVGEGNTFGHPKLEVLRRLNDIGAKIYRTDQKGAITFTTDGQKISVDTYVK